jgi:hypothetical protein
MKIVDVSKSKTETRQKKKVVKVKRDAKKQEQL